ncbi:MAG: hypothetical protein RL238_356 [Actinomycetota bacterium]|jgi:hypothetical protein
MPPVPGATDDELCTAGTPSTDPATIEQLRGHADVRVRVLCARHPHLSPTAVVALARDAKAPVRAAIAARADLPSDVVSTLVRDHDRRVRRTVLRHQDIDVEMLVEIIGSGNGTPAMEERLIERLRVDPALTLTLFQDPRWRWIASAGRFESKAARRFAAAERWSGLLIAQRASLSDAAALAVARSPFPEVQEAIARRDDLSDRVRRRMVLRGRANAAAEVMRRPQPLAVRMAAACRRSTLMRVARAMSSTSPYFLWHSASSAHFSIQLAVALNPHAGPRARKRLRSALRWALDEGLARRQDLDDTEYISLARHGAVLLRLAENPRTPLRAIDWMISYGDQFVSQLSRIHPSRPIGRIHAVADDGDAPKWLLRRLAAVPTLPDDLRERVLVWLALGGGSGDPNFDPVTCAGTPGDLGQARQQAYRDVAGANAADSSLWMTRMMKAVGASTLTEDVLVRLARDAHPLVRTNAARFNGVTTTRELRSDPDAGVRRQAEHTWTNIPRTRRTRQRRRSTAQVGGRWARSAIIAMVAVLMSGVLRECADDTVAPSSTTDPRSLIDQLDQPTWVVTSGRSGLTPDTVVCTSDVAEVHVERLGILMAVTIESRGQALPVDFQMFDAFGLMDQFQAAVRPGAFGVYQVTSFAAARVEVRIGENATRAMVVPFDETVDVIVRDQEGDC